MAGKGDHSVEVNVNNYASATLDIQSATTSDGSSWISGGGYTVPKQGGRLGISTGQVWGVYTNDNLGDAKGTVILRGDGGSVTITFDNTGNSVTSCTFHQGKPVELQAKPVNNTGDDKQYAVWTCDINDK